METRCPHHVSADELPVLVQKPQELFQRDSRIKHTVDV